MLLLGHVVRLRDLGRRPPGHVVGRPRPHLLEPVEGVRVLLVGADDAEEGVADDVVQALVKPDLNWRAGLVLHPCNYRTPNAIL